MRVIFLVGILPLMLVLPVEAVEPLDTGSSPLSAYPSAGMAGLSGGEFATSVASDAPSGTPPSSIPEPPTQPTYSPIDDLVDRALDANPSIRALRAHSAAARERIAPAGALPDPMLEVMLQEVGVTRVAPMSMASAAVRQEVPWPGKRQVNSEVARAMAAVADAQLDALSRRIVAGIRTTYAELYALDREIAVVDDSAVLLQLTVDTVSSRYLVGQGVQEPAVKAKLTLARLQERREDLTATRRQKEAELERLVGTPALPVPNPITSLPPVAPCPEELEDLATGSAPDVLIGLAEVRVAEQRVAAARLDLKPDLFAGLGLGVNGDVDPAILLQAGMTLPVRKRQRQIPMLHASERDLDAARQNLLAAQSDARAAAGKLAAAYRRDVDQIERYQTAILPQAWVALEAGRAAYLTGGDFSMLLEDFQLWLEARARLARREADRFITRAEIDALVSPVPQRRGEGGSK